MQIDDVEKFESLLAEVAECYDRKRPTPAAVKHWFDALGPFAWLKVEAALKDWLTTKSKFPNISEIRNPLHEQRCSALNGERRSESDPFPDFDSCVEQSLHQQGLWKRNGESHDEWMQRMRAFCKAKLPKTGKQIAKQVRPPERQREPGDDDE